MLCISFADVMLYYSKGIVIVTIVPATVLFSITFGYYISASFKMNQNTKITSFFSSGSYFTSPKPNFHQPNMTVH
jgi:predicted Na+-dependent transporter